MITKLKIKDSFLYEHEIHQDNRGYFSEYLQDDFKKKYFKNFLQQNISHSKQYTLRGLHFQEEPFAQAKLLTVLNGSIYDFFIDLRINSPSYLETEIVFLNDYLLTSLYVPSGCAHGFFTLEKNTKVLYSVSEPRSPENERSINPLPILKEKIFIHRMPPINDELINISDKDRNAPTLKKFLNSIVSS